MKRGFNQRLKHVKEKVERVDKDDRHHRLRYAFIIMVFSVLIGAGLLLGVEETGNVVFSEDQIYNMEQEFFVTESGSMKLDIPMESTKTLMLSGEVFGEGKAEVYLETEEKTYLAYYFQGKAEEGKEFENMCIETCNAEIEDGRLIFKLEGARLRVDEIKHMSSRLIEFELQPKDVVIDYPEEMVKNIPVKLINPQRKDFKVFLYLDGVLSDYFSWQGSIIEMTPEEEEKEILLKVRLPEGLEGEYVNKLTARYVPPGDKDFVGSAPVDEMLIKVDAKE